MSDSSSLALFLKNLIQSVGQVMRTLQIVRGSTFLVPLQQQMIFVGNI
jgi:hypothetical protein